MKLDIGPGTALVGAGIFSIHEIYTKHAGSLSSMRNAPSDSGESLQKLVDADCLAGGLTLLAGGALALATHEAYPLILAAIAFVFIAFYYHATLRANPVRDTTTMEGE